MRTKLINIETGKGGEWILELLPSHPPTSPQRDRDRDLRYNRGRCPESI